MSVLAMQDTGEKMPRYKDLTGEKFGMLTVLEYAGAEGRHVSGKRQARWLCRCECGKLRVVVKERLRRGTVTTCGSRACKLKSIRATRAAKRAEQTVA